MKNLVLIISSLLLTSFGYNTDENQKATIYILRPTIVGFAIPLKVFSNQKDIGTLNAKSFLKIETNDDTLKLSNNFDKNSNLNIDVRARKTYFILNNIKPSLLTKKSPFILLDEEKGKKILEKLSN
jgi:hypothetical protein